MSAPPPTPTASGFTLPHNLDAEASVLGGIILRNETLAELPELEVESFYDHRHKVVFQAMRNLEARRSPIDVVTLEVEVERAGKLASVGGIAFFAELALRVPTPDNVRWYAQLVSVDARNRAALIKLSDALLRAQRWPHEAHEMVAEVAADLARLDGSGGSTPAADRARWSLPLATFLGDEEPDDDDSEDWIVRDLIPRGEPVLLGGPMKGGKTWTALDLCIAIALGEPWLRGAFKNEVGRPTKVLGIFLEDNKRRLRKRLWELCRARGITPNDERLRENLRISREPLRLPDAKHQRQLAGEIKQWGAQFVSIDNLTRVMVGDPNSTREAAAFTRTWTDLGDETGAAIQFLHHTKKSSGEQKEIDPFDQLRGSGDFGAAARNIIVTKPIKVGDAKASEFRVRGNLDLRRESFVVGFERLHLLGRWQAQLTDRGDVEGVREGARKDAKDAKETKRKAEYDAEQQKRRSIAIAIATKEGSVSGPRLAQELGLKSPRAVADVLAALVQDRTMVVAGKRGFELAGTTRQAELPT